MSDDRSLLDYFLKMIVIDRSSKNLDQHSLLFRYLVQSTISIKIYLNELRNLVIKQK
jgi:hypothetical protein